MIISRTAKIPEGRRDLQVDKFRGPRTRHLSIIGDLPEIKKYSKRIKMGKDYHASEEYLELRVNEKMDKISFGDNVYATVVVVNWDLCKKYNLSISQV